VNHPKPLDFEGRQAIRCIQQIAMLKLWEHLRGDTCLPDAILVQGSDLERTRDKLMLLDVVWNGDEPHYLIRFHGIDFERMNNRNCVGRFLHEAMPAAVRDSGLPFYRQVLERRLPAFGVTTVRSGTESVLSYERLLLPFTRSGQEVEQIYCVLTLFAEDNASPYEIVQKASRI
jgi:hypothetical protein